jgi:hypothetical protein
LFGQTYCTGQGGFCSYGPLPRNEDWGIIFAEMPSWVEAPDNHPLVGAFPTVEIEIYGWPRCQDQKVTKIRWNEKQQHLCSDKV